MKPAKYGSCAIAYGLTLCLSMAQSPSLLTPGTSTEMVEAITTGTRTTFTLKGNTILGWDQLNLLEGSELVYNFQSGEKVLNLLSGSNRHRIDGTVTSNGTVGFFSPNASLNINGTITAKGVILSTHNVKPDEFFSEGGYSLNHANGSNRLFVGGRITATQGNAVIAGSRVSISENAVIQANDSLLIGGGSEVSVSKTGGRKLNVRSEDGDIIHLGISKSPVIEIVSGGLINNTGRIDAGKGQVFIDVGNGMEITNESTGLIVAGSVFSNTSIVGGSVIVPDEGDSAPTVGDGTLNIPELTRPDGRIVSQAMQVRSNAPVSASSDGGRDSRKSNVVSSAESGVALPGQVAGNRGAGRPLLRRSSFFGIHGGDKTVSNR
jgi:filamentous hemagglutinin family protein